MKTKIQKQPSLYARAGNLRACTVHTGLRACTLHKGRHVTETNFEPLNEVHVDDWSSHCQNLRHIIERIFPVFFFVIFHTDLEELGVVRFALEVVRFAARVCPTATSQDRKKCES